MDGGGGGGGGREDKVGVWGSVVGVGQRVSVDDGGGGGGDTQANTLPLVR
jgi:hypothetical protein